MKTKLSKQEILERVGTMAQLAGIRPYVLREGRKNGVSAADLWNGSGLSMTVLSDRASDIYSVTYQGRSLCWLSGVGASGPWFAHNGPFEWDKNFGGGMLATASRLYKYPFHEQLMIFAQRPDATACAEYDLWNDTMRRYVRRGSKGIALVDNSREKPRLRYVFDISDTGLRKNSRHPFLWELRPEHEAAVAQALAERFGTPPENNLAEQLESIAAQLVSEYWVEHKRDIHIRPTFSLTGQPPRMCRSCWDILM